MTSANSPYTEIAIPTLLNPESIGRLTQQLEDAEASSARFIVLTGSPAVFCNGLDLAWVANSEGSQLSAMEAYAGFLKKLQSGQFISIALINGQVSGGGMGIVCACDHVIAAAPSTFSLPEGLLGLIPGMILPSLLNRLSPQRIKKMVLTGRKYTVTDALHYGIVDELSEDPEKTMHEALLNMRACKPAAVKDMKQVLYLSHLSKDELAHSGMAILNARIQDPEIRQRLKDIADFM